MIKIPACTSGALPPHLCKSLLLKFMHTYASTNPHTHTNPQRIAQGTVMEQSGKRERQREQLKEFMCDTSLSELVEGQPHETYQHGCLLECHSMARLPHAKPFSPSVTTAQSRLCLIPYNQLKKSSQTLGNTLL